MNQTLSDLNAAEEEWVKSQLELAKVFVGTHAPEDSTTPLALGTLDRAFKNWISLDTRETAPINEAINALGVAFGQILSDGLGMRWVIATDEHGSDLAVYADLGQILIYPANFVAKRWERRETDFLEAAYREIAKDVQAIQESAKPKRWWKF